MKLLPKIVPLAFVSIAILTSAQAATVDWKLYGGANFAFGNSYCFYEEKGITKPKLGFLRVWTKCLLQKDMDDIPPGKPYTRAYIDMSAQRIAHGYRPPILDVERMQSEQVITAIMYETLADVGDIVPHAQIFYEIDCHNRKFRELSLSVGGQSKDTPSDWKDAPPEGNAANMLSLFATFSVGLVNSNIVLKATSKRWLNGEAAMKELRLDWNAVL